MVRARLTNRRNEKMTTKPNFAAIEMPFATAVTAHFLYFRKAYAQQNPANMLKAARCWFWHALLKGGHASADEVPAELQYVFPESWGKWAEGDALIGGIIPISQLRLGIEAMENVRLPNDAETYMEVGESFEEFISMCAEEIASSPIETIQDFVRMEFHALFMLINERVMKAMEEEYEGLNRLFSKLKDGKTMGDLIASGEVKILDAAVPVLAPPTPRPHGL
jgi:hypothetical protein